MIGKETHYEFGMRCWREGIRMGTMWTLMGHPSNPKNTDDAVAGYVAARQMSQLQEGDLMIEGNTKYTGQKVIGFSLGRCIRSIVLGEVALDDVVVVISQTAINTDRELEVVIESYMGRRGYLMGLDHDTCLMQARRLRDSGKLHQPRLHGQSAGYATKEVWAVVEMADVEVAHG